MKVDIQRMLEYLTSDHLPGYHLPSLRKRVDSFLVTDGGLTLTTGLQLTGLAHGIVGLHYRYIDNKWDVIVGEVYYLCNDGREYSLESEQGKMVDAQVVRWYLG